MTLQWKRLSDTRKATECGRYTVDREPHYDDHPAVNFRYVAKHATNLQADPIGTYETFDTAANACQRDLIHQLTNHPTV